MQIWVDSWILARQESCNGQMAAPRVGYQAVSTCNGYVVPLECYPELKLLPELSLSIYIICTYVRMHVHIQDKSFLNENLATGLAIHANKLHQDRQCSLHSQRYSKHVCNMPSGNQTWQYRKSNIHRRLSHETLHKGSSIAMFDYGRVNAQQEHHLNLWPARKRKTPWSP